MLMWRREGQVRAGGGKMERGEGGKTEVEGGQQKYVRVFQST